MLQPGFGAAGAVGFPLMGVDQFRGREIPEGERMEAMIRNFAPNWAIPGSGTYAGNKIDRAMAGKRSKYKDEHTPLSAWMAGFGPKVVPNDTRKNKQRIEFKFDAQLENIDRKLRALKVKRKEGMITTDKYYEKKRELKNQKQRIKKSKRKAIYG